MHDGSAEQRQMEATLVRAVEVLEDAGIEYALMGGLASAVHTPPKEKLQYRSPA